MQTSTRRLFTAAVLLGFSVLSQHHIAFAQAKGADPVLGTWLLNLGKSTFEGTAAPGKRTMIFTAVGDAIKHTTSTIPVGVPGVVVAGGNEYTAKYDGADVHITGSFLDTVSLKRIDARTVERTGKVMGKAVETMTRVLSADGKTLTVTTKGTNPETEMAYSSVQVFERQ
jgi:hypothetical protein